MLQFPQQFPPGGVTFRGGGFDNKYLGFFTKGKQYRVPGFLATSFYGGDHGNIPGSDTHCARFAGCGYDPRQARAAGEGLRYLRGLDSALADVPLQVQEYAAMVNAEGRGPTFEPGAFGGACKIVILSPICLLSVSLIQEVSLFQTHGAGREDQRPPLPTQLCWCAALGGGKPSQLQRRPPPGF